MAEILATKTSLPGCEGPGTFEAARAGALFASTLQPSGSHSPGQIRRAVKTTLQRLGVRGCAARVADEFGDHPDTAVARMRTCGHLPSRADRGVGLSSGHDQNAQDPETERYPR